MMDFRIFKVFMEITIYWGLFILCTFDIFNRIASLGGRLTYGVILLVMANITLVMRIVFWNILKTQIKK